MAYTGKSSINREVLGKYVDTINLPEISESEGHSNLESEEDEGLKINVEWITVLEPRVQEDLDDEFEDSQSSDGEQYSNEPEDSTLDNISSDDSISLYLKEMAIVPLLSVEEEINLAQRIEYARDARREVAKLSGRSIPRKFREFEEAIQDGFLARDNLIRANTRLVVSIARRYVGRGVPFLDLIQEGNLGLIRAVEKYEYKRGFRFSTYATWWIRQAITRAIADQGRTIRVPVHMIDRLRVMYKTGQEMEQDLGREPTPQELAGQLNIDQSKVEWMLQIAQTPISLESPTGDDDESEFGMYVEDEASPSPSQIVYQTMLRERVEQVLNTLSPREARILCMRFGLGHDRPYTLEEVGQKFGLTRERIRQIESMALRRLRQPCRARLLREYI
jgi:RNA polymerase primary sigma factor